MAVAAAGRNLTMNAVDDVIPGLITVSKIEIITTTVGTGGITLTADSGGYKKNDESAGLLSFTDANPDTIGRFAGSWSGLVAGDRIIPVKYGAGSLNRLRYGTIASVVGATITLSDADAVVSEATTGYFILANCALIATLSSAVLSATVPTVFDFKYRQRFRNLRMPTINTGGATVIVYLV